MVKKRNIHRKPPQPQQSTGVPEVEDFMNNISKSMESLEPFIKNVISIKILQMHVQPHFATLITRMLILRHYLLTMNLFDALSLTFFNMTSFLIIYNTKLIFFSYPLISYCGTHLNGFQMIWDCLFWVCLVMAFVGIYFHTQPHRMAAIVGVIGTIYWWYTFENKMLVDTVMILLLVLESMWVVLNIKLGLMKSIFFICASFFWLLWKEHTIMYIKDANNGTLPFLTINNTVSHAVI